mmetsp:Transcript_13341/g.56040  ORF Transcript_13341/g.56040 Transcript_13341/m.56040 type:complete len:311 (+) Transcript_13341:664-1596(+)
MSRRGKSSGSLTKRRSKCSAPYTALGSIFFPSSPPASKRSPPARTASACARSSAYSSDARSTPSKYALSPAAHSEASAACSAERAFALASSSNRRSTSAAVTLRGSDRSFPSRVMRSQPVISSRFSDALSSRRRLGVSSCSEGSAAGAFASSPFAAAGFFFFPGTFAAGTFAAPSSGSRFGAFSFAEGLLGSGLRSASAVFARFALPAAAGSASLRFFLDVSAAGAPDSAEAFASDLSDAFAFAAGLALGFFAASSLGFFARASFVGSGAPSGSSPGLSGMPASRRASTVSLTILATANHWSCFLLNPLQ